MSRPQVTVVLPVHNRREITLRALRSLERADTSATEIRVVVVDDGSTDGTAEAIARQSPAVTLVRGDGSLYYAGGTNAGVARALDASPDYVLIGNDDAVYGRSAIPELVKCARQYEPALVGALLLRWDAPHLTFQVGQRWDTWFGGWRVPQRLPLSGVPARPWEAETLAGNCILVPAAAFRQCGLLDARRFPHRGADAEFCARALRAGWRLLVAPRARVFCQPNSAGPSLRRRGVAAAWDALLRDRVHPSYLPVAWRIRWASAPSTMRGALAVAMFTSRLPWLAMGWGRWPRWPDPVPRWRVAAQGRPASARDGGGSVRVPG